MDELAARHGAVYARCAAALRAAGAPAYEYLLHLFGVVVRCTAIGVAAGSVPASSLSQGLALSFPYHMSSGSRSRAGRFSRLTRLCSSPTANLAAVLGRRPITVYLRDRQS